MVFAAARAAVAAQAWMVWLMCVVVTYEVDSWMERGASRPAVAGNVSPECEIFLRKSIASWYGVPEGVKGTAKNLSPAARTESPSSRQTSTALHATNDH